MFFSTFPLYVAAWFLFFFFLISFHLHKYVYANALQKIRQKKNIIIIKITRHKSSPKKEPCAKFHVRFVAFVVNCFVARIVVGSLGCHIHSSLGEGN